ncbi:universal stress protein [Oxalobacteraceae bacterium R-40]|uniref:Universal stress protein n=1 Tax=Keguizhuia sedimenti TaxID=3064264 RepID=A0ABU1BT10_9BURK|nr:universal stress protein [Oxalobacteraceae bacterium R-40]
MFKSILVPIDGTSLSYKPISTAIEFAKLENANARLVMVSVAEPRMFNSVQHDALHDAKEAEKLNVETAKENIRKALASVNAAGIQWESVISVSSTPCDAILETAKRLQCDLILMATRGKMGIVDTFFNESTTQEVLRKTLIPVLVFPDT